MVSANLLSPSDVAGRRCGGPSTRRDQPPCGPSPPARRASPWWDAGRGDAPISDRLRRDSHRAWARRASCPKQQHAACHSRSSEVRRVLRGRGERRRTLHGSPAGRSAPAPISSDLRDQSFHDDCWRPASLLSLLPPVFIHPPAVNARRDRSTAQVRGKPRPGWQTHSG